jgi:hypothetical protein
VDLTTLITAAGLLLGVIVANAAYFGNALYVSITIPTKMEQSGFGKATVEQIFVAELHRYLELPSIMHTPSIAATSTPSLPQALAKPLQLQDVVFAVQAMVHDYGVVNVNSSIVDVPSGPNLNMVVIVSNPPDPPVSMSLSQPDGDVKALVERAARQTMIAIGPYRVAVTDFEDGVTGDASGFDRSTQTIARGLAQGWDPRPPGATEDVLLVNLRALLDLRDGKLDDAAKDFVTSKGFPGAFPAAYSIVSLNQAFLAIAQRQPDEAERRFKQGAAAVAAIDQEGIASRVKVLEGLVAWSQGKVADAEKDFIAAINMGDNDAMPHLYLAHLLADRGDTAGAALQRKAGADAQRFDPKYPALAYTIFQVDPEQGGLKPAF